MSAPDEDPQDADPSPEAPTTVIVETPEPTPPDPSATLAEERELALGPYWRHRRFLITSAIFAAIWLFMIAFIRTGVPPSVYFVLLLPFYLIAMFFAMRTPKQFRRKSEKTVKERLNFTNKLTLAILAFIAIYIPFTFISNRLIPYAPMVEFFVFVAAIYLLYRLVGRSVGVAPSLDALPPATHRRHKQVVLPIDDPHYQKTLFLNYDFVDRGKGARSIAKRLDNAMESLGVDAERRKTIVEDLEDYHEGFHWGLTRSARAKNKDRRARRSELLQTVYNKFNRELEQGA